MSPAYLQALQAYINKTVLYGVGMVRSMVFRSMIMIHNILTVVLPGSTCWYGRWWHAAIMGRGINIRVINTVFLSSGDTAEFKSKQLINLGHALQVRLEDGNVLFKGFLGEIKHVAGDEGFTVDYQVIENMHHPCRNGIRQLFRCFLTGQR
jgi:hypothetical protein